MPSGWEIGGKYAWTYSSTSKRVQNHPKKINQYQYMLRDVTSAHAFGSTKRPIRPASLALKIFSNSGTMVEFELDSY